MVKRLFDIFFSFFALIVLGWLVFICFIVACIDTQSFGIFIQNRVGQHGQLFKIFKIKTFHPRTNTISAIGAFLRKTKLDELPQLCNVLMGDMSFVGPRPDIPGYYDLLQGEERKILSLKPGITSWASLKYANEEELLSQQKDPLRYNDEVIFPDKVKMNLEYYYHHSLFVDVRIIINTLFRT